MLQVRTLAMVGVLLTVTACEPTAHERLREQVENTTYVDPPASAQASFRDFLESRIDSLEQALRDEGLKPMWKGSADSVVGDTTDLFPFSWGFAPLPQGEARADIYEAIVRLKVQDTARFSSSARGTHLASIAFATHGDRSPWLLLLEDGYISNYMGNGDSPRQTDLPFEFHYAVRNVFSRGAESRDWFAYVDQVISGDSIPADSVANTTRTEEN